MSLYPDVLGAVLEDPYEMGATRRVRARYGAPAAMRLSQLTAHREKAIARTEEEIASPLPGVPAIGPKVLTMGMPTVQFTNTSALTLQSVAQPQKPFQPYRLIIGVTRSAAGSGGAITLTTFSFGTNEQRVAIQPQAVEAYAGDVTYSQMKLDPVQPGVDITLAVTAAAQPGVGETVDVTFLFFGLAIS